MPDEMDRIQAHNQQDVDDALARHRRSSRERPAGLTRCETPACGEPIEPERTRLGARLCSDCQQDADIRARQYASWRNG